MGSFDPLFYVSRTSFNCNQSSSGRKYGKIWAPHTKTRPLRDWLMFVDSGCPCSTLAALQFHLLMNTSIPAHAPLFAFKTINQPFIPMRRDWFMTHCNEIWSRNGFSMLNGHSFRIGGTTHLLLLGVDPFIVTVQGRWTSNAFLAYWCLCEKIIPLFIRFLLDSHASILNTMSVFRNHLSCP